MLKNYLKIAFRNIKKQKTLSLINILGLVLGMVANIYMLIYVIDEFSYESDFINRDKIYRIGILWGKENENIMKFSGAMPALAPAIKKDYPNVESSTRVRKLYGKIKVKLGEKEFSENKIFYVDKDFVDIFSVSFIRSNKDKALTQPNSIVLTKSIAEKYFGKENPIGKTIELKDNKKDNKLFTITGVIENPPVMTHLKYNMLVSYSTLRTNKYNPDKLWQSWGMDMIYVLAKENTPQKLLKEEATTLLKNNTNERFFKNANFAIQPLKELHWINDFLGDLGAKGNKIHVIVFLVAAILILAIACFNFVNLSVVQFLERIKEVGVRKVFGANKKALTAQFIIESLILTFIAFLISLIIFEFIRTSNLSFLSEVTENKENYFKLFSIVTIMVFFIGLLGGIYPAFYFSRIKPIEILKNKSFKDRSGFSIKKSLVLVQFVISLSLISSTLVVVKQMNFAMNSELGYTKENAVIINYNSYKDPNKYKLLRDELLKNENIKAVSGSFTLPGTNYRENMGIKVKEKESESVNIQTIPVDYGYIKAMELELLQGRDFSAEHGTDITNGVILNEAAVKLLNIKSPIGKTLEFPNNKERNIIGIVNDFHLQSIHQKISALVFYIDQSKFTSLLLRFNKNTKAETIKFIEETCKKVSPLEKINYTFLSDSYEALYKTDNNTKYLLFVFAFLSIVISALGLLGLTLLSVNKRIKEIGIRKVLGATISDILLLIAKEYLIMVVAAIFISAPIVFYLMNEWLQTFAYRATIGVWIFFIAGFIALTITLITVSGISLKSALINPVKSLKDE